MNFLYENQGHLTYLTYEIEPHDRIDSLTLGMITNNKIHGVAQTIFTQLNNTKYLKYNVSAKIPVQQFFSGIVSKKHLLGVFQGIISAIIEAEEYMIEMDSLVFDLNYIFTDVSNCETVMICLPILNQERTNCDLNLFFKNIMFSTQFDQSENCDYVAKILNYLNSTPVFSIEDFNALLKNIEGADASKEQDVLSETTQSVQKMESASNVTPVLPTPSLEKKIEQPQVMRTALKPVNEQNPASAESVVNHANIGSASLTTRPAVKPVITQPAFQQSVRDEKKAKDKSKGVFSFLQGNKTKAQASKLVEKTPVPVSTKQNFAIPGQPTQTPQGFAIPGQPVQPSVEMPKPNQPVQQQPVVQQEPTPVQSIHTAPQEQAMNFGETTVLNAATFGETTVLDAGMVQQEVKLQPYLIRAKNNERIELNKPVFRIGKEKSYVDYFISDNTAISRSHANVISRDGEYFIVDTNSTNHTYVNGMMIQSNVETKIVEGAKIRLANEEFEFKLM